MQPVQVPGTLFVLLIALAALQYSNPGPTLLLLALGCACGWGAMSGYGDRWTASLFFLALVLWALAFLLALTKVL
jgi:hypothetical protein